ncbi:MULTISPECIES: hypothetical protein [unclassified Spirillospora]|uniref:hypothetical protein n=1 Tax=unclassified Spirillospora TaxID=2642701 RepID=UPI003719E73C
MRRGWFVLVLTGMLACLFTGPATALERAEPVSRADHLAAELRRHPVYVTDHTPRVLPPDAAAQIEASVARLGVPAYVAVTPTTGLGPQNPADSLIALLRDRLGEDGIYLVVPPSTPGGEVRQFGGARRLPVEDAWRAASQELPYDATAPEKVARFVDIALSGQARERADNPRPRPKSEVRKALDADEAADRRAAIVEWGTFGGGAALSGLPILALLIYRTRGKKPRPAPQNQKQAEKKQAKGRR